MRQFFVSLLSVRSIGVRIGVLVTVVAAGLAVAVGNAQSPPPQGVFHTGATAGIIRDATKVGNTIYAVGTWANSGAGGRIDGALWTFDGANAPTRTALPDIAGTSGALAAGDAITPDAAFIANQVRGSAVNPGDFLAVRVERSSLTNLNLTPAAAFPSTDYNNRKQARAISDSGAVLYGQVNRWLGLYNPPNQNNVITKNFQARVMRFDVSGTTVSAAEIYPQAATVSFNGVNYPTRQTSIPRGASGDGSVAIFSTFSDVPFPDNRAYRYVHGVGSTAVSLLPGGTVNAPGAVTDDGKIVALVGDSTRFPNREIYIADYSTGTEQITALGSPNEPWGISATGISGDGSVVAATASTACAPNTCRYAYFHNSNGWFQLTSAMAAAGMDLTGWFGFQIAGMSADGTMVWGSGIHNGAEEGYVAEFPADFLKNFDVVAAAPADTSIVGVWAADGTGNPSTADPASVTVFMRDGTYYTIEPTGFERGSYKFDGHAIAPTTRLDANGYDGLSDGNGAAFPVGIVGDELRSPANCVFDALHPDDCFVARRLTNPAGSIDGGWVLGDPTRADSSAVIVFSSTGKYFMAEDGDPVADPSGRDGIEIGQAMWNPGTGTITVGVFSKDTNGQWGLSHSSGAVTGALSADELQLVAGDSTGTQTLTRVVDPATVVPVVTGASFNGVIGASFSEAVTASRALTFEASGLPSGLAIDSATGVIAGTPAAAGAFDATVTATNALGSTGSATIHIQIDSISCTAGSYLAAPSDVSCTPAPAGSYVPSDGAASATPCAVGSFSSATGAVSCTPAPAGSYVDTPGATSATPCAAGTFSSTEGAAACTPAPADTYVDVTGATSPTPCPAGLSSDLGATVCDDRTPPTITGTPGNITTAATGPSGAVVTWPAPTAVDSRDGVVAVSCAPSSGSVFPKGTTQVTCAASDAATNIDTTSFYVTVGQPSPPSFTSVPASQQVQATGPGGAAVIYSPIPAAEDAFGQALAVVCAPASGSTLPLGQTKVTCTATDTNGLSTSVQFTETVVDTLAPAFTYLPGPTITVEATSDKGAVVSYQTPTVVDLVDPLPTMKCDKASGQAYPIGNTVVSCTTADHSGNSTTQTFVIAVADTSAPTVTITKPVNGTTYRRGQKLAANYTCTDSGAGILSCAGTLTGPSGTTAVTDGALINTNVAGDYTFTVIGKDKSSNSRTVVVTFRVQ